MYIEGKAATKREIRIQSNDDYWTIKGNLKFSSDTLAVSTQFIDQVGHRRLPAIALMAGRISHLAHTRRHFCYTFLRLAAS